jgi:hypothetical protein
MTDKETGQSRERDAWIARGLSGKRYDQIVTEVWGLGDAEIQKLVEEYVPGLPVADDLKGEIATAVRFQRLLDKEKGQKIS